METSARALGESPGNWRTIDSRRPTAVTDQGPRPLGQTSLRKAQWFDLCPMTYPFFKEMVEVVKEITPTWRMQDMHAIMR